MYKREISSVLKEISEKYPVLTVVGPRQSGKSTLVRALFKDYQYVSLEDHDIRQQAKNDPRGFFNSYSDPLIIDEVQRVPEILSYIQTRVDESNTDRQYILTGSNHLLLMEQVTQSLAGRTFIAKLLPLSWQELKTNPVFGDDLNSLMLNGGYPRIYDKELDAGLWLDQYLQTYVEKDVRQLLNIKDLELFNRFLRLCAGRVGQVLDLTSLGNDCGVSQPTAKAWLSVLKASFICYTLEPHFKNFNKRIIKSPKLYFYDTGLLCRLLKINSVSELDFHASRGHIFENFIVSEKIKKYWNQGLEHPCYYWRDAKGHEIDLIEDQGSQLYPIEIKSAQTFHDSFLKNLKYFNKLQGRPEAFGSCIYAGDKSYQYLGYDILNWKDL